MSELKRITLPDRDEMLRRLRQLDGDDHIVERLYEPLIAKLAGERRNGPEIVSNMVAVVGCYAQGYPMSVFETAFMNVERYIRRLIDDKKVREEALEFYNQIGA